MAIDILIVDYQHDSNKSFHQALLQTLRKEGDTGDITEITEDKHWKSFNARIDVAVINLKGLTVDQFDQMRQLLPYGKPWIPIIVDEGKTLVGRPYGSLAQLNGLFGEEIRYGHTRLSELKRLGFRFAVCLDYKVLEGLLQKKDELREYYVNRIIDSIFS